MQIPLPPGSPMTMLTVIETCRQQSRNVFTYVTATDQAHLAGQPTPSLLPEA